MSDLITAYAIRIPTQSRPLMFLHHARAAQRAADLGQPLLTLSNQAHHAGSAVVWAVRTDDGSISLHADPALADRYAQMAHGTVHPLAETADALDAPPARTPRFPHGELTPGGLMRL